MSEIIKLISDLCSLMTVTSSEYVSEKDIRYLLDPIFDESRSDAVGNLIFVKKCGKENAKKILIDAHLDEIGMMVNKINDDGSLGVVNVGGLDTRILPGTDVIVYGKETIHGVVTVKKLPDDEKKLPKLADLAIDTFMKKEDVEKLVRVGTYVGYAPKYTALLDGQLAGKGLDDKSCAACAAAGIGYAKRSELAGDVYLLLSVHEETDRDGGAKTGSFSIDPDVAMVIDVNLGRTPDTPRYDTVAMGAGPSIDFSAVTDRKLTKWLYDSAKAAGIKVQPAAAPMHTGTNAPSVAWVRYGIPTVDVGLPLKSMHTYNEILREDDAEELAELVKFFVCNVELGDKI